MTTAQLTPTTVQVMAARVRMKADRRLKRETPAEIKAIAGEQGRSTAAKTA